MSVEQYSKDVIVVAVAEKPSDFRVWLREQAPAGLSGDLRWLSKEDWDSHVILDLTDLGRLETANYALMLNLQRMIKDSDYSFVLCGLSPHVKWQLDCMHLSHQFDTFETREAAIMELAPLDAY
jgi:anti-anti-sigma regulatory factor